MSTRFNKYAWLKLASNAYMGEDEERPDYSPTLAEHRVLIQIFNYTNEAGEGARRGSAKMARETGLSSRAVKQNLKSLVDKGWLRQQSQGGGRGHAAVYALSYPKGAAERTVSAVKGERRSMETVNGEALNGEPRFTPSSKDHKRDQRGAAPTRNGRTAALKLEALYDARESGSISGLRDYGLMFPMPDAPAGLSVVERREFMDAAKRDWIEQEIVREVAG